MKYNTGQIIFFSPTKSTLKVIEAVAGGMGFDPVSRIDLTFPVESESVKAIGEVVVVGVPVYAGRVPNLAVERLRQYVQGEGRPVVLVAVYGNRAYEDALLELRNLTEELGFVPCAAGAFIAQHSYSSPELPVAPGRPNDKDIDKAHLFGSQVRDKIQGVASLDQLDTLEVPGNIPHRDGMPPSTFSPVTDKDTCTLCGECAHMCPTQVVSVTETGVETDVTGCIWCGACIKACPTQARFWDAPKIREINTFLHEKCAEPKDPETFL